MEEFKSNLTALLSNKAEEVETAISSFRASNNMHNVNINEGEYPVRGGSSQGHYSSDSGKSMDEEDLKIMLQREQEQKNDQ